LGGGGYFGFKISKIRVAPKRSRNTVSNKNSRKKLKNAEDFVFLNEFLYF
jgi:hypothetical protein